MQRAMKTARTRQTRKGALVSVNGSALVGLDECPLHRNQPFGICNVRMTQFSIARFAGGIVFNGEAYTYLPDTDELIRDDVLRWRVKQLKAKPEKKWCAWCGVWGDHQSGSCPELKAHNAQHE